MVKPGPKQPRMGDHFGDAVSMMKRHTTVHFPNTERARRGVWKPGPALTTAYGLGDQGHAVLKITFAELLRSCSRNHRGAGW